MISDSHKLPIESLRPLQKQGLSSPHMDSIHGMIENGEQLWPALVVACTDLESGEYVYVLADGHHSTRAYHDRGEEYRETVVLDALSDMPKGRPIPSSLLDGPYVFAFRYMTDWSRDPERQRLRTVADMALRDVSREELFE